VDERQEVELETQRAIVYLPKNCYKAQVEAQCIVNGETIKVREELSIGEIAEAKRKAADGYFGDLPATCSGMPMSLMYLPGNAVYVRIDCESRDDSGVLTNTITLAPDDLSGAFYEGDQHYIDEDDVFTLTEKGRQLADEEISRL